MKRSKQSNIRLHTDTPFGAAIVELFDELTKEFNVRYPSLEAGYVKAYVFGGAAMHLYTREHSYSNDVDTDFDRQIQVDTDIVVEYVDEQGISRILVLDTNFNINLGLIHPDYRQDATPFLQDPYTPLWVYLASPIDLAVSKVVRFFDIDREDIRLLAEKHLISEQEFIKRMNEALPFFVGNATMLHYNIRDAREIISKACG